MSDQPAPPTERDSRYGAWGPPPPGPPPGAPKPPVTWRSSRVWVLLGIVAFVLIAYAVGSSQQPTGQQAPGAAVVQVIAPSSLCWSGAFGDRTVQGCGNDTVPLEPASFYSANAQKQDDGLDELTLVLRVGGRELDRTTTWAQYGVASVSGGP